MLLFGVYTIICLSFCYLDKISIMDIVSAFGVFLLQVMYAGPPGIAVRRLEVVPFRLQLKIAKQFQERKLRFRLWFGSSLLRLFKVYIF